MFSIPRDTEGLPLPPKSRLSQLWGPNFPYKLNGLWKASDKYRQLFPNGGVDALKQALGYTFFGNQSAIQYYALVNFDGFKKVIDTFGGVTIDVGSPVIDDGYPGNGGNGHGKHYRVYIPAGIQHMNGDQALTYARTRHNVGGNDYARAARQQQVLVSLEQQANIDAISSHLSDLVDALGSTVHTDIPQGPEVLGPLVQMAKSIKMDDIKQYVFSPPIYMSAGYTPNIPAIRAAVKAAISGGAAAPDQLQAAIAEDAPIIVENGSGVSGQDSTVAAYLQALGLNGETSPTQPSATAKTTLICVNGAETKYPATLAELELLLGISGTPSADPSSVIQTATEPSEEPGFVLITANASPWVTSPPSS
jgi:LCP family protein required for cell wall assembly